MTEALEKVHAQITEQAVTLTKRQIMDLWNRGIINDQAYIYLAIKSESLTTDQPFDVDEFCQRWEAVKPGSEKMKTLKTPTVLSVLAKFADKEAIELTTQLSIGLF